MSKKIEHSYSGELYFEFVELSDEQKDAIHVLSGLHPDDIFGDSDENEEPAYDPVQYELMIFLMNIVQLPHREPFSQQSLTPFADLVDYGELLLDLTHLMAKVQNPRLPVLAIASITANYMLDFEHTAESKKEFLQGWKQVNQEVSELVVACRTPGGRA